MPFVNTIRRHHTAHHNQSIMMDLNMNLTFPVMDWLFGTSDLNRGLLGHLFNGYSTKYLKQEPAPDRENPAHAPDRSSRIAGHVRATKGAVTPEPVDHSTCKRLA